MNHFQGYKFIILAITALMFGSALCNSASAQTDTVPSISQTVRGFIISTEGEQPVIGARIVVLGTRQGANSKADGSFRIPAVGVGRHTLAITSLGFEPAFEDILVTSGKQVVITISVKEKVVKGEEVVVSGEQTFAPINESTISSVTGFTVDDVKRFAGSREDPARMAQNFAGVVGVNDQRNDIIVRGGSPTELLWRLDGIDIPNPNHFATEGATGGPVNAINVNLLSNSDFLTGAFPAEYGDKLSGVFDLHTRKGNTEKYEFVGQIGFAGFEGMAEGPIPGITGSSFIASYRKSTVEVFNALGISFGFAGVPKYDDLTIKADMPLGERDAISIISLLGTSDINIFQSTQKEVHTGDFDLTNGTDLGVVGATWRHIFSDKSFGLFTASWNDAKFRTNLDSLTTDNFNHVLHSDQFYNANSNEGYYSAKYRLSYSANVSNVFTGGLEARLPFFNLNEYRTTVRNEANGIPYSLKANGNSNHELAFVNWLWRPNDDFTFNSGIHFQYLGISKRSSIEPRISGRWQFAESQDITAAFGVHRQSDPLVIYFGNAANQSLDFTQSLHYVLGYENHFANDLLFKAEAYYKDISNAPVERDSLSSFSMLNSGSNFGSVSNSNALKNAGLGKTYGVELTLMKHFTDNYYITATTSLFKQRFTGSDGIWHDGAFDNRYIVNLLAGYDWVLSPKNTLSFSAKFSLAGGAPYTPIDTAKSDLCNVSGEFGPEYFDESRAFADRYPTYTRLDVKIEWRENFGSISIISFFTAENVLNTKNVLQYTYNPQTHGLTTINQLGIFPYGGFRIEF